MIPNLSNPVEYSEDCVNTINHLKPLEAEYWNGSMTGKGKRYGIGVQRDAVKVEIKEHLRNTQGYFCCYCGLKLKRTSPVQIEHIAPQALHPEYLFTPLNLAFVCSLCVMASKKKRL